jgi:branched-chain amino acid aminotransferase
VAINPTKYIWHHGQLVPWADATEHVMSHTMNYGTSVFEGIRAYDTPRGPVIFRLRDHIRRLFDSAKIYRIDIPFTLDQICDACRQVVVENQLRHGYIRPLVYCGVGDLSLARTAQTPVRVSVAAFPFGKLHGDGSTANGIDACVSSWQRTTPASQPMLSKAGGHYLNSQLIAMEAIRNGYAEGIAVVDGYLSEGAGENIFVVRHGILHTPPLASAILNGITRDTILTLAEAMALRVIQEPLPREMLYVADEVFLTGTAAEITPIRSIDRLAIGGECPGQITRQLQHQFYGLFTGQTKDRWNWLDPVST